MKKILCAATAIMMFGTSEGAFVGVRTFPQPWLVGGGAASFQHRSPVGSCAPQPLQIIPQRKYCPPVQAGSLPFGATTRVGMPKIITKQEIDRRMVQLHTALEALDPRSTIALKAVDPENSQSRTCKNAQEDARKIIDEQLVWLNVNLTKDNLSSFKEVLFYAYQINSLYITNLKHIEQVLLEVYGTDGGITGALEGLLVDVECEGGY